MSPGRFVKPLRFATANRCRLIYFNFSNPILSDAHAAAMLVHFRRQSQLSIDTLEIFRGWIFPIQPCQRWYTYFPLLWVCDWKILFPLSCDWKIVGTRKSQDPPFSAHTGFLTKYRVHRCNYCFVSPFLRHETWIFSFFTHLTDSDTFFGRKHCGRKWSSLHRCPVLPFYVSSTPINRWFTHFIGIIMVFE